MLIHAPALHKRALSVSDPVGAVDLLIFGVALRARSTIAIAAARARSIRASAEGYSYPSTFTRTLHLPATSHSSARNRKLSPNLASHIDPPNLIPQPFNLRPQSLGLLNLRTRIGLRSRLAKDGIGQLVAETSVFGFED